ncbi:hypothetical protein MEX01_49200 [Methylorubrum extorquens]|nr:hypothetical protein MEX01_49200 [Methylorubrum extorquens]
MPTPSPPLDTNLSKKQHATVRLELPARGQSSERSRPALLLVAIVGAQVRLRLVLGDDRGVMTATHISCSSPDALNQAARETPKRQNFVIE